MSKHEILLVDDDPDIIRVVGQVLDDKGYQITMETSGEAAVEILSKENFDLVITDLNMHQADGFAVLKKAKAQNPQTVVIVYTGDSHVKSRTHARSLGFDDYLTKPGSLGELLRRVDNCLETLDDKRRMSDREGEGKGSSYPGSGRRSHPRYTANEAVYCYCEDERILALALDLGQGGMKIKTPYHLPEDEYMNFKLVLRNDHIWLKGRRVYSKLVSDQQMFSGIEFLEVSGEDHDLLRDYLATLEEWPKRRGMISAGEVTEPEWDNRETAQK